MSTTTAVLFAIATIAGAIGPAFYGAAEGRSLENITAPLTAATD